MKVLFLTTWYPTSQNPTHGIFVREHARASQQYHEVHVLHIRCQSTSNLWGIPRLSLVSGDDELVPFTNAYIDLPRVYAHGIGDLICAGLVVRAINRLPFKPDVIHCNITLPGGLAASWLKRTIGMPTVLTEHSSDFSGFYCRSWRTRLKTRMVLGGMDAIMPVGKGQENMIRAFWPRGRYTVVPNAVDTNLFTRGDQGNPTYPLQGLVIGALLPHKGYQYLLRAYAALPDDIKKKLQILALGDGPLNDELLALRSELQIEDGVRFVAGGRPKSEIAKLMQQCDFLVHPSLREATPCVIGEAMACGKPALVTRCDASEYLVTPETGQVVEKGNVEALRDGLVDMVKNYHRYDGAEISRQAHAKYSYGSIGKQFDEVYRSVVPNG